MINAQPPTPTAPVVGAITQPTCTVATGSVVLSGLPAGNWTINPGNITGNTATTTINGLATGTYNFTVTSAAGCTSPASANVVINAQPPTPTAPVVGAITQPTCTVATGSVVLSGLPAGNWTINPGNITGNTATTTINNLAPGTYNYTVTNAAGCTSPASANVVINAQPPTPTAPVVGAITQPTCTVATGSVVLSGLPAGNWTINPGNITGNTATTTINGLATGTYNFTVTSAAGCTSPASANVVINAQPPTPTAPVVGAITQPTCTVATGSVVLSGLPAGNWTINPGNITGNTATTTINGLATGTYNFTVTSAAGCTSPASANVVINAQPPTPTAPVVGAITQPTCTVATGSVVLSGLPAGNWTLTMNPGAVTTNGTGATTTVNNLAPGTYTFTVSNAAGCTSPASANVVINAQPPTPTAPVVGAITQPTCTVATGSVVLSGLPAGNWTINPGNITGNTATTTINGLATGTYNFTVTSAAGCTSPASANVVINAQPPTPTAPVVGAITQPTCTVATGSVVLSGLPAGNWTINPGNITGNTATTTINNLAPGTYNYTVTNAAGCTSPASANVVINAQPPTPTAPVVGAITQPTCTVATGSVVLSGLPAGNWTINPGNITGNTATTTINGLATGTYNFTVTSAAGCTSPASANVVINAQPPTPTAPVVGAITQPTCTVATGSVVLSGLPAGNWTINPGNITGNTATTTINGLATGTYNFTVTSAAGCTSPASANVVINAQPPTPTAPVVGAITQPTCTVATGSVVLSGLPAGNWTLTMNPGAVTTNGTGATTTVNNLAPGTYTFTVSNAAGCTSPASANVVINAQPPTPTAPVVGAITQPTCTVATGSVVLSGLPAGNWTINPGNITGNTATTTINGLATGTYNFTVTSAAGCTSPASANVVINAQPPTPTAPVVGAITQPTCTVATGSVVLSGLPAGNWTINPGNITGNTATTTINNLAPGTYNYTVTNAAGCTSPASANVVINAQPPTPTAPVVGAITQPTCTVATGSVVLSGLPAGNWTINPGNITGNTATTTINGLATGTYNFTVTSAAGCTSPASANVVINAQPPTPTAPVVGAITQPTCTVATGSVVLSGLPAGNWTINPGNITGNTATTTINGLATGTYNFTVTSAAGCTSPASANVVINAQPPTPTAPVVGAITQPTCTVATGSVVLSGLPAGNWTLTMNPGAVTTNGTGATTTVNNLAPGTYTFTVSNAAGCTSPASANVVINAQPPTPTAPVVGAITQPTCTVATGSVVLSGLPAGNWTINPGNITGNTATTTINGLATGTYNFTVTSAAGCTSPASANVVIDAQPPTPTAPVVGAITQPTCTVATGSVVLSGLPAGNWTINPGNITGNTATTTINNLAPGTYNYTVTNAAGCTSPASANVVINAQPPTPTAPVVGAITQPTCTVATGSVVLSGLPAAGMWTLTMNPGGVITTGTGATTTINNLAPGTYTFTVTNAGGCTSPASANVVINAQPPTPTAPVVGAITQPTCTVATGSVVLSGLPAGNWTLTMNPGAVTTNGTGTTATISNLAAGVYTFTVINASGCISPVSANVVINTQPPTPTAPVVSNINYCQGEVTSPLTATGTNLLWYTSATGGTGSAIAPTPSTVTPGTTSYWVSQTNANGCEGPRAQIDVAVTAVPPIPSVLTVNPTCLVPTGTITITAPIGAQYTYSIDGINFQANPEFDNVPPGDYTVTVQNTGGCSSSIDITVNTVPSAPPPPTADVAPVCTSTTATITVTAPLGAQYTYSIDGVNFQASTVFSNVAPGSYTLTLKDAAGCSSASTVIVNAVPPAPTTTIVNPTCSIATGTITVTAPLGAQYSYSIDGVNFQASTVFNNVSPNTYTLTVQDAGGCSSSASVTVNPAPSAPPVPTATVVDPTCSVATGTITVTAPLGAQYTYSIDGINFQASATFNNVSPNTYTLTVKNTAGCSSSASVTVNTAPSAPPTPTATVVDPTCSVATGTITVTAPLGAQYTYSIDGINFQASTTFNNVSPNTYTLTVKNTAGCSSSASVTVNPVPSAPPVPTATIVDPTCSVATGTITVTAPLGAPYTYSIDGINFQASAIFNNVSPNTYTLTVQNTAGCSSSASVTVNPAPSAPPVPTAACNRSYLYSSDRNDHSYCTAGSTVQLFNRRNKFPGIGNI